MVLVFVKSTFLIWSLTRRSSQFISCFALVVSVHYLPAQELIQELAPGESYYAYYKGKVTIGLGCCCDENLPVGCECNSPPAPPAGQTRRLERGLQSDGVVDMVFAGEDFVFTVAQEEAMTGSTAPKCSDNFFLSLLQSLLGWLLRLFGKGPFCV
jgi:hypothetical protein